MPEQNETKMSEIEKRVNTIENYFKVGFIVAIIFGVGGAFGLNTINNTREKITILQGEVSTIQSDIENLDQIISEGIAKLYEQERISSLNIRNLAPQVLKDSILSVLYSNVDQKYLRIGDLQICWGTAMTAPDQSNNRIGIFQVGFPKAFASEPNMTTSLSALGDGCIYNIYRYQLSEKKYTGWVLESRNRGPECKVTKIKLDYVAIGKWK